jgi:hypothetical protein
MMFPNCTGDLTICDMPFLLGALCSKSHEA